MVVRRSKIEQRGLEPTPFSALIFRQQQQTNKKRKKRKEKKRRQGERPALIGAHWLERALHSPLPLAWV